MFRAIDLCVNTCYFCNFNWFPSLLSTIQSFIWLLRLLLLLLLFLYVSCFFLRRAKCEWWLHENKNPIYRLLIVQNHVWILNSKEFTHSLMIRYHQLYDHCKIQFNLVDCHRMAFYMCIFKPNEIYGAALKSQK